MRPVYIINGFLESGKTEFIIYTLAQPYFRVRGKTLLLLCEEGEIEYDEKLLKDTNTILELIEEEEDFTPGTYHHRVQRHVEFQEYEAALALEHRAADHLHRCFHIPDVLYQHEISAGRDGEKIRDDHF